MPSLDDLVITLAAAETGHFGSVAVANHVSQSTVSRAVSRVEAALGRKLFVREGRTVRVNPEAADALTQLRTVADTWLGLRTTDESATRSPLSLFCTVTASQSIVPALLADFRRAHPSVVLQLRTGPASAAVDAVTEGSADAAIALLPLRLPRPLVSLDIAPAPLIAVAAQHQHDWSGAAIILPRHGLVRSAALRWCRRALPAGSWTVEDADGHEEVVALAALGSGIGIVPQLVVDVSALRPSLRKLTAPEPLPVLRLGLCARRGATSVEPLASLWRMVAAKSTC